MDAWRRIPWRMKLALAIWMTLVVGIALLGWLIIRQTDSFLKQETVGALETQVDQAVVSMDQWFERYELLVQRIVDSERVKALDPSADEQAIEAVRKEMKKWKYALPGILSLRLVEVDSVKGTWNSLTGRMISEPDLLNAVVINQNAQSNLRQVVLVNGLPQWFRSAQGWFGQRQPLTLTLSQRLFQSNRLAEGKTWIVVMDINQQTWANDMAPFWNDPTRSMIVYNTLGEPVSLVGSDPVVPFNTFSFNLHGEEANWEQTIAEQPNAVVSRTTMRAPWIVVGYSPLDRNSVFGVLGWSLFGCSALLFFSGVYLTMLFTRDHARMREKDRELNHYRDERSAFKMELESVRHSERDIRSELERTIAQRDSWFRQGKQLERQYQQLQTHMQSNLQIWKSTITRSRSLISEVIDVLNELKGRSSDRWAAFELNSLMDQMELYLNLIGPNELLQPQPVMLRDLVTTSWETGTFRQTATGVGLRNDISTVLPPVLIDPGRMRYVFQYLFSQIMLIGSNGQMVISAELSGNFITVVLREPGYGVSMAQWEALFGGKEMTKSLGSAIVQQLVLAHGGMIRIEANERQGCAIVFTLPIAIEIMQPMEQL